jgi:tetratricopeptide (TPR) repeat protein
MTLQDVDSYRNPKDYLLTGVAWYRIDNLEEADRYFAKALDVAPKAVGAAMLPYKAQARLWRAIVAERSGKRAKAQYWMRELVDHHPHSKEAQWVNSKEARRAVAGSRKAADEPSHH